MSTQDEPTVEQPAAPTVSTAPTGGTTAPPPRSGRWHWGALPDHLGRARTSTVVLAVLFLAVFTLYLNVRPDPDPVRTSPAGDRGQVEAPVQPSEPSEPAAPTTTSEPEPTGTPDEEPATPTTTPPSSPTSTPSEPTEETTEPTGTSEPTGGTGGEGTPTTTSTPAP